MTGTREVAGVIEGQTPTRTDVIGAGLAILGALVVMGFAARARQSVTEARLGEA